MSGWSYAQEKPVSQLLSFPDCRATSGTVDVLLAAIVENKFTLYKATIWGISTI